MAKTPVYDVIDGSFGGYIKDGNTSFPAIPDHPEGKAFLDELAGKGETLQDFLNDNPFVAPTKSADKLADEQEQTDILALNPDDETNPTLKLLLKREQRRSG